MAICHFDKSGKVVRIYEEILPKLTIGNRNQEKNVWEVFEIVQKKVKNFTKLLKIELLTKLPKNLQKILGYRYRKADSKNMAFAGSRTAQFQNRIFKFSQKWPHVNLLVWQGGWNLRRHVAEINFWKSKSKKQKVTQIIEIAPKK